MTNLTSVHDVLDRLVLVTAAVILCGLVTTVPTRAATNGRVGIDRVKLQTPTTWSLTSGIRWESGRTLTPNNDYTNYRLTPVSVRYGLSNQFELGGSMTYSSNSADQGTFPDEGGIEGFDLMTKARWNRNLATAFTVGYGLSDDVFPYGGDGLQVGLNFPAQLSLGPGTVLAEVGFTINNGEATVGAGPGSATAPWNDYFNYGLGYYYELTDRWRMTTEIVGHGKTIEGSGAKSLLEVRLVPEMILSKVSSLRPSLGLGLSDGSPNFGLGVDYTFHFGDQSPRRVRINEEDIESDDFGSMTESTPPEETPPRARKRQREKPLVLPGELESQTEGKTSDQQGKTRSETPRRNPKKAQELANRGREAFEDNGNLNQAINYFKRAVKYDPDNVEILSNLGSLLYRKGNYTGARKYYQRALEVDPNDQFSHLFLGITLYKMERYEQARNHLKRARSINPSNQSAQRAQRWLERVNEASGNTS